MELNEYVTIVRTRWLAIVVTTVVSTAGALGISALIPASYQSSAQIFVSIQSGSTASDLAQGSTFARQQVISYSKMATSPLILEPVIDELGLQTTPSELGEKITAESPLNTSLIDLTVTDRDPAQAAAIANAVAEQFQTVIEEIETPTTGGKSNVRLSIVRDAVVATTQTSPNLRLNTAFGFLAGFALGLTYAVLREVLDTRIREVADVQRVTDHSVIGTIPRDPEAARKPLIVQGDAHSARSESTRRLRTNLQFLGSADADRRSIVITSPVSGEGKSTTAINLAIALADAGQRVCLVDADLRQPSIASYLGITNDSGLTSVLIGQATMSQVVQTWGSKFLHVMPSGQIPPNPTELLGSTRMRELLGELYRSYEVILIDTPPLLPVTDGAIIGGLANGVVVVVRSHSTTRTQLAAALSSLESVNAEVLGLVLNQVRPTNGEPHYHYPTAETGRT